MASRIAASAAVGLLWACGGGQIPPPQPSEAPVVTAEELTAPVGHLTLGKVTLVQGDDPVLILHSNGALELPREQRSLGKLESSGRFVDPTGKLRAELTEDGEVLTADGDYLPVTISPEGEVHLVAENRRIKLRADGSLDGANPDGPVVTLRGVTERTRRVAMYLLVLSAFPVKAAP